MVPTGLSGARFAPVSIAGDDAPRNRYLDDGTTAAAGREVHACQLGVRVHGRAADVGDPPGRFGVDQFDEPRRDVAGVDGLEPHSAQRPQQRGEPLDREDHLDQVVELGGAQHRVPDTRGFQGALDAQLGLVVRQRDPVDADDRHIDDVSDAGPARRRDEILASR